MDWERESKRLERELSNPNNNEDDVICSGKNLNMMNKSQLYTIGDKGSGTIYKKVYRDKEIFWILNSYPYPYVSYVQKVTIPDESQIFVRYGHFETDMLSFGEKTNVINFINQNPFEAVRYCSWALQYIVDQTEELCVKAVTRFPLSMQYVQHQTDKICWKAFEHYYGWLALQYIKDQTYDMCMDAVRQGGRLALQYVHDEHRTKEICEIATKYGQLAR